MCSSHVHVDSLKVNGDKLSPIHNYIKYIKIQYFFMAFSFFSQMLYFVLLPLGVADAGRLKPFSACLNFPRLTLTRCYWFMSINVLQTEHLTNLNSCLFYFLAQICECEYEMILSNKPNPPHNISLQVPCSFILQYLSLHYGLCVVTRRPLFLTIHPKQTLWNLLWLLKHLLLSGERCVSSIIWWWNKRNSTRWGRVLQF